LHSPIDPLYIFLDESDFSYISIKIKSASIPATIDYVKGIMKKFSPRYPFVYSFFDDLFEKAYKTEQRMFTIFGSFSILAIIIACLGLFGLISFATEQRTKEIGIRKVLGASVQGIVGLLITKFIKWVLMANIIAWPLAYFAMNKWLQNFAYRTDMSIWIFIISGLTALAIALLTVSYQSIKAATANPVDSLRYE
jgi:putative ABC transport system permease protein